MTLYEYRDTLYPGERQLVPGRPDPIGIGGHRRKLPESYYKRDTRRVIVVETRSTQGWKVNKGTERSFFHMHNLSPINVRKTGA